MKHIHTDPPRDATRPEDYQNLVSYVWTTVKLACRKAARSAAHLIG